MRQIFHSDSNKLHAAVFAGTRAILIALDVDASARTGLKGFAFKRFSADGSSHWLTGMKVFPSLAPQQPPGKNKNIHFPTNENPIQSLIWSDYEATPQTDYKYEISAMYLRKRPERNRGAAASATAKPGLASVARSTKRRTASLSPPVRAASDGTASADTGHATSPTMAGAARIIIDGLVGSGHRHFGHRGIDSHLFGDRRDIKITANLAKNSVKQTHRATPLQTILPACAQTVAG